MKRIGALVALAAVAASVGCGQVAASGGAHVARDKTTFASMAQGGRKVVRISVQNRAQVDDLATRGLDLFENVNLEHGYVEGTVTPKDETLLRSLGYRYQVLKTSEQLFKAMGAMPAGYHTVAQVKAEFQKMSADFPHIARFVTIGKSVNDQELFALRISAKPNSGLPQILFNSGQHARELPPVEMSYRLAAHLTSQYGKDPQVTKLVDTRDITIVPVVNPDGRQNVESGDSYWRKNMRKLSMGARGVDTNRNSDDHWDKGNNMPWADDYHGTAPTSEPETQAMRDLVGANKFTVSVDIHNYGGMVLWPPGFDNSSTRDEPTFSKIGNKIASPVGYRAGTIARTIYRTYGDFSTWQYQKHGIVAFGIELDDSGFNAPFSAVEKDWQAWKDNFMFLISVADDPRKQAQQIGDPLSLVGFKL
ncbi:MAG: zinc carboxypeptidase [Candidatus Sericytochromatia bacterium]|nr:zinc carboxypeptidase [Candidatus Tanganyikabacteria bacterium]